MVAVAGPLTNLIIILIADKLNLNIFTYIMILLSNIVIIIFNMLPVYPMDGGRILKGILHIFLGKKKSLEYIHKISFFVIIIITIIASIGILYLKNIAIFLAVIYLWYIFLVEQKQYKVQKNIYEIIEKYWNKIKIIVNYTKEKESKRWKKI